MQLGRKFLSLPRILLLPKCVFSHRDCALGELCLRYSAFGNFRRREFCERARSEFVVKV